MAFEEPVSELRRAHRVPADFWVMVQGVDAALVARRGNISTTGIIFAADDLSLELGSLEYLHVTTSDRKVGVVVMAQVVRIVDLPEAGAGPKKAIAFEFMPVNMDRRHELVTLVQYIIDTKDRELPAPQAAQVFALEVSHLTVETSWPVEVGDKMQLAFQSSRGGTRIPFEGVVQAVNSLQRKGGPPRYKVETGGLVAGRRGALASHASITESIDIAMADIIAATSDLLSDRPHLKGNLDRISLASVLSWFDMGRMSGRMRLTGPDEVSVRLYLQDGRLVDVEGPFDIEARETLRTVLSWKEGRFEFHEGPMDREDKVQTSMAGLLLDLAREADESSGDLYFVA